MEQRINFLEKGHNAITALYNIGAYLSKSSIEQSLLVLVYFRVSQINGCAFCLDMHSKDLMVKVKPNSVFITRRTRLGGSRYKDYKW